MQYADSKEVEAAVLKIYPQTMDNIDFLDNGDEIIQELACKKRIPKTEKRN